MAARKHGQGENCVESKVSTVVLAKVELWVPPAEGGSCRSTKTEERMLTKASDSYREQSTEDYSVTEVAVRHMGNLIVLFLRYKVSLQTIGHRLMGQNGGESNASKYSHIIHDTP